MREVAAVAGVGIKTVSRVVNGEPGVSNDLRGRVRAAIERLDYRQDLNASLLRRTERKTATIGLVLDDISNPFSSALGRSVEDVARERGVLVFSGSCEEDPARERELIAALQARRVDGLLVAPAGGAEHSYLLAERRAGTALVFVDRPARFLDADSVVSDNEGGAQAGVSHLADVGHRRIAFLGDDVSVYTANARLTGYLAEVSRRNFEPDSEIVRTGIRSISDAEATTAELLRLARPPTAIFAGQNLLAIGAVRALRAAELEHTVALVGFDDFLLADLLEPAVTVIAQDPAAIGRAAANLLFERLDGDESPSRHIVLSPRLIPRGSGEIPPKRRMRRGR